MSQPKPVAYFLLVFLFIVLPTNVLAKKIPLKITSDPIGAKVEINGKTVGTTPFETEIEDWAVKGHGTFVFSKYLAERVFVTISKEGYVPKSVELTQGPFQWSNHNRTVFHTFYVFATTSFDFKLEKKVEFTSTNPFINSDSSGNNNTSIKPDTLSSSTLIPSDGVKLTTEEIVSRATQSVVTIRTENASGTGFFITDSGIIVTNKHVIGANTSVVVINSKGETFRSEAIYIHPLRDLALVKISGSSFPFLRLANPSSVNIGADVVAIGSPGIGNGAVLAGTVTKGIVSAFRNTVDDGVLVQTDVAINHGNSGGPLLNNKAEVVGINTLKLTYNNATGINFAIFSSEILQMLKERLSYVPNYANEGQNLIQSNETAKKDNSSEKIAIPITSEPTGCEIYIDDIFIGSTPSKAVLVPGEHTIRILRPGFSEWKRTIKIDLGSSLTVNAVLEKLTN